MSLGGRLPIPIQGAREILGAFAGEVALGLFNQAYNLTSKVVFLINGSLSTIILPALSRARPQPATFSKPLVLHCRDAFDDLIAVLRRTSFDPSRMVFHCFTGRPDDARKVLDFGAWISFTGIVTFQNARDVAEAAKLVPSDRIMVETDSPFLTPEPHRKVRPNEPKYAMTTARALAELRGESWDDFHAAINRNTERFFGMSGVE